MKRETLPDPETLDVDRLARALMEADTPGRRDDKKHERMHREHAARIAAEYAKLVAEAES